MSLTVLFVVLFAALLHAVWNALLKNQTDKHAGAAAVAIGGVPLGLLCLLATGLPEPAAWPYVAASAVIHTFYFLCLLNAYRAADFTAVYPIARGSAPVITAIFGAVLVGEVLSSGQTMSVMLIAAGVMSLVFTGRGERSLSATGLGWAFATGILIASYSLNDGVGARLAGSSWSFYGAAAILNCLLLCLYLRIVRPGAVSRSFTLGRRTLLLGGPLSFVAYAMVTWAFANAPIALVSALREVSILFAVLIGTFVLRERMNWRKIASSFVTLAGVMLLRTAR